jgi:hypothetical protein
MCVFVSVVQCVCVPMYTSRVHGNSHTTTARRCPFCLPRRSPHPHPRAAPIFRVLIALWLRARPRGRAVAHPRDGTAHTRHTALQVRVLCAEDPRSYIARWSSVAIEMQMVFSFAVTFEHAHVSSDFAQPVRRFRESGRLCIAAAPVSGRDVRWFRGNQKTNDTAAHRARGVVVLKNTGFVWLVPDGVGI